MKKMFLLGLSLAAFQVRADLTFYDGFNYTSGNFLAPRTDTTGTPDPGLLNTEYSVNWRYAGAGGVLNNVPTISSAGLTYEGLRPGVGNSALYDMTQIGSTRIQVTPSAFNSGLVYWSGLVRVNNIGTLTTGPNGMLLGGFNNAAGAGTLPTVVGAGLRIRQDTSDPAVYHIGTGMNSGTAAGNVQFDNVTPYAAGQTVFVVGAYEIIAGANNDKAYMWINPDVNSFGAGLAPAPTLTSAPGGTVADSSAVILSFSLRNVNTVGNPGVEFDELRVGTTWADVTPVPEPTTGGLLGLGILCFIGWLRARNQR